MFFCRDRLGITSGVEFLQVEDVGRFRFPKPQRVDGFVLVAGDGHVVRHGKQVVRADPTTAGRTGGVVITFGMSVELDRLGVLGTLDLPRVAVAQPVIGGFDLAAILDLLVEHAKLVSNPVSGDGQFEVRATVEKARSQSSQAAVAQTRVQFLLFHFLELQTVVMQGSANRCIEIQVLNRVVQRATEQELERKIVDAAALGLGESITRVSPVLA